MEHQSDTRLKLKHMLKQRLHVKLISVTWWSLWMKHCDAWWWLAAAHTCSVLVRTQMLSCFIPNTGWLLNCRASLVAQLVKNPPAMWETWVQSLGWEDPLEKGKAVHYSILAWRSPWTVEAMGSQRVGRDWATFTCFHFKLSPHLGGAHLKSWNLGYGYMYVPPTPVPSSTGNFWSHISPLTCFYSYCLPPHWPLSGLPFSLARAKLHNKEKHCFWLIPNGRFYSLV